ncbi:uncharacterized protein si:dkey-261j15.2 [Triplophysa rosa]|uniref:Myb/SANT-like DNA-binding domain-containing protein n=1 Tax=Triplophysa rosa TaxID=992332 RepID=A0A9W8C591_TRIRA|nr:uncharacterized protein si:dkey-261j15.2 [Triplophysa rosa]KAI7807775.1 hypothetical protein IRJ41_010193 [Triplophysa rosa]
MSENKNAPWSCEETNVLLAIWSSTEIQEKLNSKHPRTRNRVYDEIRQEMLNGGLRRSTEQVTNKLKKLRKEYRDQKMKASKSSNKRVNYGVLESVLGHRPESQLTGALNSATAMLDTDAESQASADDLGSRMSEPKIAQQWSSEETSVLLAIWSSAVIQEQFQRFKRKKKVYDQISQKMADAGFSRSALQIVNKLKKIKKTNDNASKTSIEQNNKKARYDVMDAVLEHHLTGALNSATVMLETKTESLTSSEADIDCFAEIDVVLDQAESSFSPSQSQPKSSPKRTRVRKIDSNQELLEYLKASDERFMEHAKELNTAILNKIDEATNSMLGLLERMVAVMEGQQGNKQ